MRKIIVLNNQLQDNSTTLINYVFWLSVPAVNQKSNPSATSLVPDVTSAELTALQNGSVIEQTGSITASAGFIQSDVANILVRSYTQKQAVLTQQGSAKNYAGAYWDGTTWFNVPA